MHARHVVKRNSWAIICEATGTEQIIVACSRGKDYVNDVPVKKKKKKKKGCS